jgi:hypothetical protein
MMRQLIATTPATGKAVIGTIPDATLMLTDRTAARSLLAPSEA